MTELFGVARADWLLDVALARAFRHTTASGRGATGGRVEHHYLRLGSQDSDVGAR